MNLNKMILLTIVAESVLKEEILEGILAVGAKGYTLTTVSGFGSRGNRQGPSGENIKVEILCTPSVASSIQTLVKRYETHYAMVAWEIEVAVNHEP